MKRRWHVGDKVWAAYGYSMHEGLIEDVRRWHVAVRFTHYPDMAKAFRNGQVWARQ